MADEQLSLLGGVQVTNAVAPVHNRFALLLWGPAKAGKTELAATAPGKKLWLNVDPDGTATLAGREDVFIADFSMENDARLISEATKVDPFGISKFLEEHPEVETVVFDSITMYSRAALRHGCVVNKTTELKPGYPGYGARSVYVQKLVKNLLVATRRMNRHCVIITHEDNPQKDSEGNVIAITTMLGANQTTDMAIMLSEIWNLYDTGKKRMIAVRPCRMKTPMGSRMFKEGALPEFEWKYNANTGEGAGISDWHKQWCEANGKIDLPK